MPVHVPISGEETKKDKDQVNCPNDTDIYPGAGKLQTHLTSVLKQVVQQVGQSYSIIHLKGCDLGWL